MYQSYLRPVPAHMVLTIHPVCTYAHDSKFNILTLRLELYYEQLKEESYGPVAIVS